MALEHSTSQVELTTLSSKAFSIDFSEVFFKSILVLFGAHRAPEFAGVTRLFLPPELLMGVTGATGAVQGLNGKHAATAKTSILSQICV